MRVTSIQREIKNRLKEGTFQHVPELIDKASASNLLLFPHIWTCGYFSFDRHLQDSERVDGPTMTALKKVAVQRLCHVMTGSIVGGKREFSMIVDPLGRVLDVDTEEECIVSMEVDMELVRSIRKN